MNNSLRKSAVVLTLSLLTGLADAQIRDFSGVYMTENYNGGTNYGAGFLVIVQKGNVATVLNPEMIGPGAAIGVTNATGFGVGIVEGNTIRVDEFHRRDMYCINRNVYTFSDDGGSVTAQSQGSTQTPRGAAAQFNCNTQSTSTVRTKIF